VLLGSAGLALALLAGTVVVLAVVNGSTRSPAVGMPVRWRHTEPVPSPTRSPRPSPTACTWLPPALDNPNLRDVGTPPATGEHRSGRATMTIVTNRGTIVVAMDAARTPCAIASFAYLTGWHFFDNSSCHRLVDDGPLHVLQCGDPGGTGAGGPRYRFADENLDGVPTHLELPTTTPPTTAPPAPSPSGPWLCPVNAPCHPTPSPSPAPTPEAVPYYPRGMVAMANSGPDTNGSQFFFVTQYTTDIGGRYEPFGTVTSGMDVIDAIAIGGDDGADGPAPGGGHPRLKLVFRSLTVTWG
jgi:peptidyl-prolyl cis-trans isomerase B (cyclophilin B)